MGIVSRMARPKAVNPVMEEMMRSIFGGGASYSGISVSNDTAMRQSTYYSCVNVLSRVIGMLPCHLMEKAGKNRNIAENHSLYTLLHDMPNEWMTAPEHWGMVVNHLVTRGNYFALKNRGLNKITGKVRELIPLAPGIVNEVVQNPNYTLTYKCIFPDGTLKDIPGTEIMHLRGMVLNGYMGMNPIQYIRESVGLGLVTERFGAQHFGSGTHPSMIVSHKGQLSDPKAMREALSETYAGIDNAHRIMLLEDGMTATSVSISPEDSQYLETRKFQKSEIVDILFGMPLTVMNSGENVPTYASAEQFSIGFVIYALLPWIVTIEKGIYRDLLTPEERKKYYAKFRAEGLQRGSFKEQTEGFATLIDKEVLCPDEVRALIDMNPRPDGGGGEYRTRTSSIKPNDEASK